MKNSIEKFFLPLDKLEIKQKETGIFIEEFIEENEINELSPLVIRENLFYDSQSIIIRKHRRFASYPLHSHQFLEFNYMLSGQSNQIVNGEKIILKEKQILLLDTNSEHELQPLGENDLLINFLFHTSDMSIDMLKNIDSQSSGLTYNFLMSAILGSGYQDNFLILDINNYPEIQITFEQMIIEFFSQHRLTKEILNSYSQVLFLQLSQVYHSQLSKIYDSITNFDLPLIVLQKIERNYRDITLSGLAAELGYNKNYLSNLIKEKTGKNFKELVTQQRLKEAHQLILSTNANIESIAEYVGYFNKTQFYKKYREYFKTTPNKVRNLR
ncbi:AraC family transcriptional regulator [Carnobacterium pleistocenium]|uniref:AraC family transcriptional regulator n=1 Tax=Carnobacterium pleistocenium TaxID=181073 RepID=UPI000552606C|nr:AraC family transcriptional regulator [Carnobacterium pleistocenium]